MFMANGSDDRFIDRLLKEHDRLITRIDELEKLHYTLKTELHIISLKVGLVVSAALWGAKELIGSLIKH